MSHYWACAGGGCCVWVEATRCAGNDAPADMRVFVHQDNLPTVGTKVFNYGGVQYESNQCWRIDPAGPRKILPAGGHQVNPGTTYDSCSECEQDVDEPPSTGGPSTGGGGPTGPGIGRPGSGGSSGGGPSCGVKLQICSDHAGLWSGPDLYVACDDAPSSAKYVRIYGYCFKVPSGPEVDPLPQDARMVGFSGTFDDCQDCAYGKRARLCPGQLELLAPDDPQPQEIWVRRRDLPASGETIGFVWGQFCYELRASDPEEVVPLDAYLLNPVAAFDDCGSCLQGIQAQRCPTEPDPGYEVWVEEEEAVALGTTDVVYFRYRELCYSLDPTAQTSRVPFDATVVVPKIEFEDCETCICGERSTSGDLGVKARLCGDQDIDLAEDVWVLASDIPDELTVFRRGEGEEGVCYAVDPEDTPREIPVGSIIARIDNTFETCKDCVSGGGGPPPDPPPDGDDDDDGPGGGDDDDDDDNPPPWWPPLPEEKYYQLRNCETGEMGGWVREVHVCGVHNIVPCNILGMAFKAPGGLGAEEECWEVVGPPSEQPLGEVWTHRLSASYLSCDDCLPDDCCACQDCDFSEESTVQLDDEYWLCVFFSTTEGACDGDTVNSLGPFAFRVQGASLPLTSCGTNSATWSGTVDYEFFNPESNEQQCPTYNGNATITAYASYNCVERQWYIGYGSGGSQLLPGVTECSGGSFDYEQCNPSGGPGDEFGSNWYENITITVMGNEGCEPEMPPA